MDIITGISEFHKDGFVFHSCNEFECVEEQRMLFDTTKTYIAYYPDTGSVRQVVTNDPTTICIDIGISIAVVDDFPDDIFRKPFYTFDGDHFTFDTEAYYRHYIDKLTAEANKVISMLSDERDTGIISDDDLERWKAWVAYRRELREMDVTAANIKWPEKPA